MINDFDSTSHSPTNGDPSLPVILYLIIAPHVLIDINVIRSDPVSFIIDALKALSLESVPVGEEMRDVFIVDRSIFAGSLILPENPIIWFNTGFT